MDRWYYKNIIINSWLHLEVSRLKTVRWSYELNKNIRNIITVLVFKRSHETRLSSYFCELTRSNELLRCEFWWELSNKEVEKLFLVNREFQVQLGLQVPLVRP